MWRVAEHYGIPIKIIRVLKNWYQGVCSCVQVDGEQSDWFPVESGLRQGCVISPTLFNMYIDHIMRRVMEEEERGANIG